MNQLVIFFVPTGASQSDFEVAWREHFASLQIREAPSQAKGDYSGIGEGSHSPLWTWFIPNPCPQPPRRLMMINPALDSAR